MKLKYCECRSLIKVSKSKCLICQLREKNKIKINNLEGGKQIAKSGTDQKSQRQKNYYLHL